MRRPELSLISIPSEAMFSHLDRTYCVVTFIPSLSRRFFIHLLFSC